MNLLPVHVVDGGLKTAETAIPIDPAALDRLRDGENLTVGIRPEFIDVSTEAGPESLPAEIQRIEDLGNFKIATAKVGDELVKAKIPEDQPISLGSGWLRFPLEHTRLYQNEQVV